MGKQGPCYHCGVTSTPLWRNGPPEKPVLCNACGSRWRTKGSLVNYAPLHSRADGEENQKDHQRYQRMKSISVNYKNKETKMLKKRKAIQEPALEFTYGFKKAMVEEDSSNRSSSGSAISNSESCAQFSGADGSELTGPSQSNTAWERTVPCKRRTSCVVGRPKTSSSVEKLTQDLYNILQEQQSSSCPTEEDDLLFENEMSSMVGHGSVLMRNPPRSFARGEDSEEAASSLSSVENKSSISDAYSHSVKRAEIGAERGSVSVGGQGVKEEQLKRSKSHTGRVHVLGGHSSPLCSIDLKDVFNFDEFIEQFTEEEQKKLMKLLPQIDSVNLPDSLRTMFESAQFRENFSLFQKLIADGVFEIPSSTSEAKLDDIRSLKKLALSDFRKSRLVESYNLLKEGEKGSVTTTTSSRSSNPNVHKNIVTIKRRCENQTQSKSESRGLTRSPKSVTKMKASHERNGSCLRPRGLASVFAQESGYEGNGSSDQDLLLLDLPSNGSFPQAELLHQL